MNKNTPLHQPIIVPDEMKTPVPFLFSKPIAALIANAFLDGKLTWPVKQADLVTWYMPENKTSAETLVAINRVYNWGIDKLYNIAGLKKDDVYCIATMKLPFNIHILIEFVIQELRSDKVLEIIIVKAVSFRCKDYLVMATDMQKVIEDEVGLALANQTTCRVLNRIIDANKDAGNSIKPTMYTLEN